MRKTYTIKSTLEESWNVDKALHRLFHWRKYKNFIREVGDDDSLIYQLKLTKEEWDIVRFFMLNQMPENVYRHGERILEVL